MGALAALAVIALLALAQPGHGQLDNMKASLKAFLQTILEDPVAGYKMYLQMYNKDVTVIDPKRQELFIERVQAMLGITSNSTTISLAGLNMFTDMSLEETMRYFGILPEEGLGSGGFVIDYSTPDLADVRAASIYRWADLMPDIKNQGECGSCWAFAATAAMECAYARKTNIPGRTLSEQELLNCVEEHCNGSWVNHAAGYIQQYGLTSGNTLQYQAVAEECIHPDPVVYLADQGLHNIQICNETAMLEALKYGPMTVYVTADYNGFANYYQGVLESDNKNPVNHAVVIVGAGVEDVSGKPYWLVRNSWGANWGEDGYVRMKMIGGCGLRNIASRPMQLSEILLAGHNMPSPATPSNDIGISWELSASDSLSSVADMFNTSLVGIINYNRLDCMHNMPEPNMTIFIRKPSEGTWSKVYAIDEQTIESSTWCLNNASSASLFESDAEALCGDYSWVDSIEVTLISAPEPVVTSINMTCNDGATIGFAVVSYASERDAVTSMYGFSSIDLAATTRLYGMLGIGRDSTDVMNCPEGMILTGFSAGMIVQEDSIQGLQFYCSDFYSILECSDIMDQCPENIQTSCPASQDSVLCLAGADKGACRDAKTGPFPSAACSSQCTNVNKSSSCAKSATSHLPPSLARQPSPPSPRPADIIKYTIKSDTSLVTLANKYRTSLASMQLANKLKCGDKLYAMAVHHLNIPLAHEGSWWSPLYGVKGRANTCGSGLTEHPQVNMCGQGKYVTALYVRLNQKSHNWIGTVGMTCSNGKYAAIVAQPENSGWLESTVKRDGFHSLYLEADSAITNLLGLGSSATATARMSCPTGMLITGISAGGKSYINSLQFHCSKVTKKGRPLSLPTAPIQWITYTPIAGDSVTTVAISHNTSVAQIVKDNKLSCSSGLEGVNELSIRLPGNNAWWSKPYGYRSADPNCSNGVVKQATVQKCPAGTFVSSVYVVPNKEANSSVGSLYMKCNEGTLLSLVAQPEGSAGHAGSVTLKTGFTTTDVQAGWSVYNTFGVGVPGGTTTTVKCPTGTLLTGFSGGASSTAPSEGITALQFFCSNPYDVNFKIGSGGLGATSSSQSPVRTGSACATYTATKEDTWTSIALSKKVNIMDLIRSNPAIRGDVTEGDKMFIPPCVNGA